MRKRKAVAGVMLAGVLGMAAGVRAAGVTYAIDPARSALTVGGNLTGNVATAQTAGGTTTSYSGTIKADRGAGTIQFVSGSVIDAFLQAQKQAPMPDGTPGTAPADYGRTADGPFFTTIVEALRGFVLDLESDLISFPGNSFPSNDLIVDVSAGESAWLYGTVGGTKDFSGLGTANGVTSDCTLVLDGPVETLTLNFSTGPIGYSIANTADSSITFSGQIVATRVPEPSAVLLACIAGLSQSRRRRR